MVLNSEAPFNQRPFSSKVKTHPFALLPAIISLGLLGP